MNASKYFPNLDERAKTKLIDGIHARTFWAEKMLLSVVYLDANARLARHSHEHEQIGIMLEGELTLTIDNETKTLKPGDVYLIPGGIEHEAQAGPQAASVLDVFSPVREEYKFPN